MERKIGERFLDNGVELEVVEYDKCTNCYYFNGDGCNANINIVGVCDFSRNYMFKPVGKCTIRTWLNNPKSPSTGNVVTFKGEVLWKGEKIQSAFLSVSDCNVSARLHKADEDSMQDFIDKMKLLRSEIDLFINYLENKPKL